jgi:type IV secretory pathway VirB9-like protein
MKRSLFMRSATLALAAVTLVPFAFGSAAQAQMPRPPIPGQGSTATVGAPLPPGASSRPTIQPQRQPYGQQARDPIAANAAPATGTVSGAPAGQYQQQAQPMSAAPIGDLQQRQEAWRRPRPAKGQTSEGIREALHDGRPIRVVLRERMTTAILLPAGEEVSSFILGDTTTYRAVGPQSGNSQLPKNALAIRPVYPGADTNLVVFAKSGMQYLFYLESYPYDYEEITDLMVRVLRPEADVQLAGLTELLDTQNTHQTALDTGTAGNVTTGSGLASKAGFKQSKNANNGIQSDDTLSITDNALQPEHGAIIHDLSIQVQTMEDAVIAPLQAYRNKHFTVLDFGHRYDEIDLPTVARVTDEGYEQQVQFRWNGSRLIISGVGEFVLRQGKYVVCIKRKKASLPHVQTQ